MAPPSSAEHSHKHTADAGTRSTWNDCEAAVAVAVAVEAEVEAGGTIGGTVGTVSHPVWAHPVPSPFVSSTPPTPSLVGDGVGDTDDAWLPNELTVSIFKLPPPPPPPPPPPIPPKSIRNGEEEAAEEGVRDGFESGDNDDGEVAVGSMVSVVSIGSTGHSPSSSTTVPTGAPSALRSAPPPPPAPPARTVLLGVEAPCGDSTVKHV